MSGVSIGYGVVAGIQGRTVNITIDGGGVAITTGVKGYIACAFAGTILGWYLVADQSGSIVIDVWKRALAIPSIANTITGATLPTLSSVQINSNLVLTDWTTTVNAYDIFGFNVNSAATVQRVTLSVIFA